MNITTRYTRRHGFSLVEVIVVSSLLLVVFGGLFAGFEFTLNLIAQSRAKLTALSLATDRIEYIKSLPYTAVGTVAGIPSGALPQNRTVSLNGITFNERLLIQYVDDHADGQDVSDTNGVVSDYKSVRIEYSWNVYDVSNSTSLVTTIVPRSIETDAGGGTIRVNVTDALLQPMIGASVRLTNSTLGSPIDVTRMTGAGGQALFTGAPPGGGYEVFVSRPGYTTDQTRVGGPGLSDPLTPPAAVAEADVTTLNFSIDQVSTLRLAVIENQIVDTVAEEFVDVSGLLSVTNATTTAGSFQLVGTPGSYPGSGKAFLAAVSPSPLQAWGIAYLDATLPSNTEYEVRFYTTPMAGELVPESVLPGNAAGFTQSPIVLTSIAASAYPTLYPEITLKSNDMAVTPSIERFAIDYARSTDPVSGVAVTLEGARIIGANAGVPVLQNATTTVTNSGGKIELTNVGFDAYSIAVASSGVIAEICPADPLSITPDTLTDATVRIVSASGNTVRVVATASGLPVIGGEITLTNGVINRTAQTGWCGQALFSSVPSGDYDVVIEASGYSDVMTTVTIDGQEVLPITMNTL